MTAALHLGRRRLYRLRLGPTQAVNPKGFSWFGGLLSLRGGTTWQSRLMSTTLDAGDNVISPTCEILNQIQHGEGLRSARREWRGFPADYSPVSPSTTLAFGTESNIVGEILIFIDLLPPPRIM